MTGPFPKGGAWRGVDLDGTLAEYDCWRGIAHVGRPVPRMLERVLRWLKKGDQVAIVTARVAPGPSTRDQKEVDAARAAIEEWCLEHLGQVIPVTHVKDFGMFELWDDRAIQVVKNTGQRVDELHPEPCAASGALDDIQAILDAPEWEYPGQIVRDVAKAIGMSLLDMADKIKKVRKNNGK